MRRHLPACGCDLCLITAAALAAKSQFPKDPAYQRVLVEAYCAGLNGCMPDPKYRNVKPKE